MVLVPWGEWKPDVSNYQGAHSQTINNVVPRGDGYGPIGALSAFSDAMVGACRGAFAALDNDGTMYVFTGTATALYKMSNADLSFADVTRVAGGAYAVGSTEQWQFTQSGRSVIACNGTDVPQVYTMGSSTNFAALSGSPPTAKYCTMVGPFLVLSGLSANPYRVQWSARDDITGWTAGTNGSDVQDFPDGGVVRGVAGGEFGWVFQDGAIRRMTFVGGDTGFEFDRLTESKGLRAPYSLIRAAEMVFFLSNTGFEQLLPGGQIVPVGKEKFDRTVIRDWDESQVRMMLGAFDPKGTRVFWFYRSIAGAAGLFDKGIVYDWALQRAASISGVTGEYVASLAQPAATLESLDTIGFTSIDAMTVSLDDISATAEFKIGIFNSSHTMCFLAGDNLEATMESLRSAVDQNRRVFIRACRPVTDAPTVYGSISSGQRLADTQASSTETAMNTVGFTPHRVDCRVAAFRNRIPSATAWTYSIGVEPELTVTGVQ